MQVPEGWNEQKLSVLSKTRISNGAFNDPKKVGSGYRLINVVNLYTPRRINVDTLKLLQLTDKEFKNFQVENGDIFFTRSSLKLEGIAHCNIFDGDENNVVYECHIMRVRPIDTKVVPKYLLEYCQSYTARKYFMSCAKTGTMTTIDQQGVGSLIVQLPPLPEQQKIAQILSTWDKAIEKLETLIAAKQKRKKALMQQLLTGKKRFAGFEGEWKEIRLGDLGKCIRGVSYKPDQILNSEEEGSIRLLRSTNIQNGSLNDKELVIIPSSLVKKNQLLEHGDLVLCMANGSKALVGKSAPFRTNKRIYTVGAFCATFRPAKNSNKDFIKFLFESETYSRELKILLSGSSINNLKGSDVEAIKMFLPGDNKEQQKIASVLTAADKEIENHQNQLAALKQQKKGLMQQLLTGKKRVKTEEAA